MTCPISMPAVVTTVWEGSSVVVLARILGADGRPITQATVTGIRGEVADLTTESLVSVLDVAVGDTVHDTLVTGDPRWPDAEGYNFAHTIPGSAFPAPDTPYRAGYQFTAVGGETFSAGVDITTKKLFARFTEIGS